MLHSSRFYDFQAGDANAAWSKFPDRIYAVHSPGHRRFGPANAARRTSKEDLTRLHILDKECF
jgi:hypothetical protein